MRWTLVASIAALAVPACNGDEADDRPDGSADTDTDTDTDADTDTDTDSDADAGTDTDTGFDFDTDYPYDLDAGLRCDGGIDYGQPAPDGEGEIPTGVERCPDGSTHRYTAVPCTITINTVDDGCDEDDCDECPAGFACAVVDNFDGPDCGCIKPCASDADCAPDEACLCAYSESNISRCYSAACHVDDDCGGFVCGVSDDENCSAPVTTLGCHSAADECQNDTQCDWMNDEYCGYELGTGVWECQQDVECD